MTTTVTTRPNYSGNSAVTTIENLETIHRDLTVLFYPHSEQFGVQLRQNYFDSEYRCHTLGDNQLSLNREEVLSLISLLQESLETN